MPGGRRRACNRGCLGSLVAACAGGSFRRAGPQGHRRRRQVPEAAGSRRRLDRVPRPPGGITALCTLALLNAGVEPQRRPRCRAARISSARRAAKDLRRRAANDGLLPGPTRSRDYCPDPAERGVAGRAADSRGPRTGARWSYPDPGLEATATIPIPSSPCWRCYEAQRASTPPAIDQRPWRLAKAYWEDCQNARRLLGL